MKITDNTAGVLRAVSEQSSAGLREIAPDVVRLAKILVPVVSGDLQESLTAEVDGNKLTLGSSLDYAAKVETNSPYLRPALEGSRANIRRVFKAK